MKAITCAFRTVGCSLSTPCSKCRAASSMRANRAGRPAYHARTGTPWGRGND